MPKTPPNGFATKADLKKLEKRMDDRFRWFRLSIKDDFEDWKKDSFREFEHRWQQLIDPVLKEVRTLREKYTAHQGQHQRIHDLLEKIAQKVGVNN